MSEQKRKLDILVFADYYLPGDKAGGPIWTLSHLVEHLGDEFRFRIITRDRDLGCGKPYPLDDPAKWHSVGKAEVRYLSPDQRSLRQIGKLLNEFPHDILYLTTLFSPCFAIKPMLFHKLGVTRNKTVIIAPMGQLSRGALKIKACKKRGYLAIARFFRLYKDVVWQASSRYESDDIRRVFGGRDRGGSAQPQISIAPNTSSVSPPGEDANLVISKKPHHLRLVFLSRISPMKNLHAALKMLQGLSGTINFDLYGPIEDRKYWNGCQRLIQSLPANIKVEYRGGVSHDDVEDLLDRYHLFFLPTLGENFAHVILEALSAGCPVLISDRTPWRNLAEKGAGWDLPLEEEERFRIVLQHCVDMDNEAMTKLSRCARKYARDYFSKDDSLELNRRLFHSAVKG